MAMSRLRTLYLAPSIMKDFNRDCRRIVDRLAKEWPFETWNAVDAYFLWCAWSERGCAQWLAGADDPNSLDRFVEWLKGDAEPEWRDTSL